jgi:hypothetical protein
VLKEGHACFLPEALTKQQRGIDGNSQHGRGYRLSDVVMIREFFGVTLEMDLKTRIARLHHDVIVCQLQLVQSFDVNGKWTAAHSDHAAIKLMVTRDRSEIVESQIRLV